MVQAYILGHWAAGDLRYPRGDQATSLTPNQGTPNKATHKAFIESLLHTLNTARERINWLDSLLWPLNWMGLLGHGEYACRRQPKNPTGSSNISLPHRTAFSHTIKHKCNNHLSRAAFLRCKFRVYSLPSNYYMIKTISISFKCFIGQKDGCFY